ncbi:MAG TPA: glycerol-3-phosphate 1-O-acyltransferase PlsY [Chloroflexota bacterium]|nr:glycerol-3-phosphate 1-O-acyltransferase PlsY [Chloroflexota bacterium]
MATWGAIAALAYLLGSIPSGVWVGRAVFGIDPREHGSRGTGATNVLRTMGTKAAFAVALMDALKGAAAVVLARWLAPAEPWAHVLAAFLVAAGHTWPLFSGFRGGKGVIVSAVAVGVLYWPILVVIVPIGALLVARTRLVSLASISGALVTAALGVAARAAGRIPDAYLFYFVAAAVLVVWTHRQNIGRLASGTENRLGQRVQTAA